MILFIHLNKIFIKKEKKWEEMVFIYVLIVLIVVRMKKEEDLLQQWELLVFGFNFKNLIKKEKILG